MLQIKDLITVYYHNLWLVNLLILSPLQYKDKNKISQYNSMNIGVIQCISSIWTIEKCWKDQDF